MDAKRDESEAADISFKLEHNHADASPLAGDIGKCFGDLRGHCRRIQLLNDTLNAENSKLKARIEFMQPPTQGPPILEDITTPTSTAAWRSRPKDIDDDAVKSVRLLSPKTSNGAGPRPPEDAAFACSPPPGIPGTIADTKASDTTSSGCRVVRLETGSLSTRTLVVRPVDVQPETLASVRVGMFRHDDELVNDVGANRSRASERNICGVYYADMIAEMFGTTTASKNVSRTPLANSVVFKAACMLAILANFIYIGIQADIETSRIYKEKIVGQTQVSDDAFVILEYAFCGWFTVELIIRIVSERREFLTGEDKYWNISDAFLVFYTYSMFIVARGDTSRSAQESLSFIRILRVFRLIRVVRVVRSVKSLRNLRTMVFAIINSFVSLMWALLMIFLIIYMFSIIFQNAVANYFATATTDEELTRAGLMQEYFGGLWETMISLFCSITGGNDWMTYAERIRWLGEHYFIIYMFYVGFCLVGLLNVVTGIFVDSAVCTRTEDEVVESFKEDQRRTYDKLREIFKEADGDGDSQMTLEEFKMLMSTNSGVKAYLSGLEIDPTEALSIFTLIDTDGSNKVDIKEFVDGIFKLKGHAKSVDMLAMMYDSAKFNLKVNNFCDYVEDQLIRIHEKMDPDATPQVRRLPEDAAPFMMSYLRAPGHLEGVGILDQHADNAFNLAKQVHGDRATLDKCN
jgi:Ca2+-binding EF-hand superfamily protein